LFEAKAKTLETLAADTLRISIEISIVMALHLRGKTLPSPSYRWIVVPSCRKRPEVQDRVFPDHWHPIAGNTCFVLQNGGSIGGLTSDSVEMCRIQASIESHSLRHTPSLFSFVIILTRCARLFRADPGQSIAVHSLQSIQCLGTILRPPNPGGPTSVAVCARINRATLIPPAKRGLQGKLLWLDADRIIVWAPPPRTPARRLVYIGTETGFAIARWPAAANPQQHDPVWRRSPMYRPHAHHPAGTKPPIKESRTNPTTAVLNSRLQSTDMVGGEKTIANFW